MIQSTMLQKSTWCSEKFGIETDPSYPWAFHLGVIASFLSFNREHQNSVNTMFGSFAGERQPGNAMSLFTMATTVESKHDQ